MKRKALLATALFAFLFTPGFVCASRVERLEGEVDALRVQFEEIQQRINNDQAQVTEMILRADDKIAEIEELQRKATDLLTGNTADLMLELEKQKSEVAVLRGQLEAEKRKTQQLQEEVAAVVSALGSGGGGTAVALPQDADALYEFGVEASANNKLAEARAAFDEFYIKFPTDPRADDALFGYIQAASTDSMHFEVLQAARNFIQSYADSKHLNDTILAMGRSAAAIGNCELARESFKTLKETSSHSSEGRRELKKLEETCK